MFLFFCSGCKPEFPSVVLLSAQVNLSSGAQSSIAAKNAHRGSRGCVDAPTAPQDVHAAERNEPGESKDHFRWYIEILFLKFLGTIRTDH